MLLYNMVISLNNFMQIAISEAQKAATEGEVPVGAVIVLGGEVIAKAHNLKETLNDPTAHAEILAIRKAAQILADWRLIDCDLYVTLEPCPMCSFAISEARIRRLYFGSYDKDFGAAGSHTNFIASKCEIYSGICEDECNNIINSFFKNKREF